eukprot:2362992-Rhodomonas_salina.1
MSIIILDHLPSTVTVLKSDLNTMTRGLAGPSWSLSLAYYDLNPSSFCHSNLTPSYTLHDHHPATHPAQQLHSASGRNGVLSRDSRLGSTQR